MKLIEQREREFILEYIMMKLNDYYLSRRNYHRWTRGEGDEMLFGMSKDEIEI